MKNLVIILALVVSAFGQSQMQIEPTPAPIASILVLASQTTIPVAGTSALSAQGFDSNSQPNVFVTFRCNWSSSNPAVLSIAGNIATGVTVGTASAICNLGGLVGAITITVGASPVIVNPLAANCASTPCILPQAIESTAYTFPFLAIGGTLPYTWSVSVGSLPAGWTVAAALNGSTGILSGTPNAATSTTLFTVQVCDIHSNCSSVAVSLSVVGNTLGPPNYLGSSPSQLTNNLGGQATFVSISSNIITLTVPNSWVAGSGAGSCSIGVTCGTLGQIYGCTTATYLNHMEIAANSSTSATQIVGPAVDMQHSTFTHANVSTVGDTCKVLSQGWSPFALAPFPAPGSANCALGNGQAGCSSPAGSALLGTWAFDDSVPGATLNSLNINCLVAQTDYNWGTGGNLGKSAAPSATGETNEHTISLSDGGTPAGYFTGMIIGGGQFIAHGHISPTGCGGQSGFFPDVTSSANAWTLITSTGTGNYGGFSRNLSNRPGVNQALRYDVMAASPASPYAPILEKRTVSYSGGVVTASTGTTLYNINTCPGFGYVTIGAQYAVQAQFGIDNSDNYVHISMGSGGQNFGHQISFTISLTNNTCEAVDWWGMTGSSLYQVEMGTGSTAGTGYKVNDVINFVGCYQSGLGNATGLVTSVTLPAGGVTGITVTNHGSNGYHLATGCLTTGGSGTGLTVNSTGIGTSAVGTGFATYYPPHSPCPPLSTINCEAPVTTTFAAFGMHSGAMLEDGTYYYASGYGQTTGAPGGSACTGGDVIFKQVGTSTFQAPNNAATCGNQIPSSHPALGIGVVGEAGNPNYWSFLPSDLLCTTPGDCVKKFSWASTCASNPGGFATHGSIEGDATNAFLLTNAPNVLGKAPSNPPNWTCGLMQTAMAVMPSGATRQFAHFYGNTNNAGEANTNFQAAYNIWSCSPDGIFCLVSVDNYGTTAGSTNMNYLNNAGNGPSIDGSGTPLSIIESITFN